jgi:hypothetical protein
MKPVLFSILLTIFMLLNSCEKDTNSPQPNPGPPPNQSSSSKIYLNGELTSYWPDIQRSIGSDFLVYIFRQNRGKYQNTFATRTDLFFADTGSLDQYKWAFTQLHGDDLNNHTYDQINGHKTKFHVTHVDTFSRAFKCEFDIWFKRRDTGIENLDTYLPDTLHFEGVIDTTYFQY